MMQLLSLLVLLCLPLGEMYAAASCGTLSGDSPAQAGSVHPEDISAFRTLSVTVQKILHTEFDREPVSEKLLSNESPSSVVKPDKRELNRFFLSFLFSFFGFSVFFLLSTYRTFRPRHLLIITFIHDLDGMKS